VASLIIGTHAYAQTNYAARGESTEESVEEVNVTNANRDAARRVQNHRVHTTGALNPAGGAYAPKTLQADTSGSLVEIQGPTDMQSLASESAATSTSLPPPTFYPADLAQSVPPGPVVANATFHNIYVNCRPTCWGSPAIFENYFYTSSFLHLVDQYVGSTANGRYQQSYVAASVSYPVSSSVPLTDYGDIAAILHSVASKYGSGYQNVYQIFLPKGTDVCLSPSYCYSPDNLSTWTFCAYHGHQDFSDIKHVIYTVIPYADAFALYNGNTFYACDVGQPNDYTNTAPTPNGVLVDSMSNFIDHETFELLTDPDGGNSWVVGTNSLELYYRGIEIGDICVNPYFRYSAPISVSGKPYYIQPVYSNKYHACTAVP
jgi:hypothetical protein